MQTETRTSAGGVVLNSKGEVLVVSQHDSHYWSLPKGNVEENEEALDAAIREIHEESGISDLTLVRPFETYQRYQISENGGEDTTRLKIMKIFLFTTPSMALKPLDPENPEAVWVPKDKVADLLSHPKDKEFFLRIKDGI